MTYLAQQILRLWDVPTNRGCFLNQNISDQFNKAFNAIEQLIVQIECFACFNATTLLIEKYMSLKYAEKFCLLTYMVFEKVDIIPWL